MRPAVRKAVGPRTLWELMRRDFHPGKNLAQNLNGRRINAVAQLPV